MKSSTCEGMVEFFIGANAWMASQVTCERQSDSRIEQISGAVGRGEPYRKTLIHRVEKPHRLGRYPKTLEPDLGTGTGREHIREK